MARMSAAERAQLKTLSDRAKAEADEDEGLELKVTLENGQSVTLTGQKARNYARKHGLDLDEEDETPDTGEDDETPDDEKPKGAGAGGYFKGKKRPADA